MQHLMCQNDKEPQFNKNQLQGNHQPDERQISIEQYELSPYNYQQSYHIQDETGKNDSRANLGQSSKGIIIQNVSERMGRQKQKNDPDVHRQAVQYLPTPSSNAEENIPHPMFQPSPVILDSDNSNSSLDQDNQQELIYTDPMNKCYDIPIYEFDLNSEDDLFRVKSFSQENMKTEKVMKVSDVSTEEKGTFSNQDFLKNNNAFLKNNNANSQMLIHTEEQDQFNQNQIKLTPFSQSVQLKSTQEIELPISHQGQGQGCCYGCSIF